MKKNIIIIMFILAFVVVDAMAQNGKSSYISANVNFGSTSLGFKVKELDGSVGNAGGKIGTGINIKYNYYFSKWGIGVGAGLSNYKSRASIKGGMKDNSVYNLGTYIDDDAMSGLPRNFTLRGRLENISEKQNITFFELPVTALYHTRFSYGKWGAYGSLGIKILMPVSKKYEVEKKTSSKLNVSGFYTDDTQDFDMGAPGNPSVVKYGFGTLDSPAATLKWKGDSKLNIGYAATFDVGALYRLTNESDMFFGLFLDYCMNEIKNKSISLLSGPAGSSGYQPDANNNIGNGIIYNGLLDSNQTDRIIPLSFGVKIGVRFKI